MSLVTKKEEKIQKFSQTNFSAEWITNQPLANVGIGTRPHPSSYIIVFTKFEKI